jgi:hypothetical protein
MARSLNKKYFDIIAPQAYIGESRQAVEIIGQKGARRFKVTDGTNVAVCTLITDGEADADGEMDLTVVDSDGGEYWVKKIGGRRCTVVSKGVEGGIQFATDTSVPWTVDSPVEGASVQIQTLA